MVGAVGLAMVTHGQPALALDLAKLPELRVEGQSAKRPGGRFTPSVAAAPAAAFKPTRRFSIFGVGTQLGSSHP
jgi:hypothetical protein